MNIASVVSRVGREKLKPIKTELPEEVKYTYIFMSCICTVYYLLTQYVEMLELEFHIQ